MKIVVSETRKKSITEFRQGEAYKSKTSNVIVLCSSCGNKDVFEGVTIRADKSFAVGGYSISWSKENFTPFEGAITFKCE